MKLTPQELATAQEASKYTRSAAGGTSVVLELEMLKSERAGFSSQIADLQESLSSSQVRGPCTAQYQVLLLPI